MAHPRVGPHTGDDARIIWTPCFESRVEQRGQHLVEFVSRAAVQVVLSTIFNRRSRLFRNTQPRIQWTYSVAIAFIDVAATKRCYLPISPARDRGRRVLSANVVQQIMLRGDVGK